MATIDSLEIQIAGSAQKANVAINDLIKNLGRLANSLKIDTSGIANIGKSLNFSKQFKVLSNETKTIVDSFGRPLKTINVSMDGMQKKAKQAKKSLEKLNEQYKDLGKGFEIKGSTQQIQKQIDTLANKLADAKLAKDDFETSGKTNLGGYETAVKNVIKYTNQIESLKNQLAGLQTAQPKLDFNITGIEEAGKKVSEVTEKIKTATIPQSAFNYNADAMKAVFGEAAAGIENWSQATQKFGANAGAVLNQTTSKTDELKERTEQFEQSLKKLQIPPINTDNINVLQRELAKSEANFEKLRTKLSNGIAMGRISANVDDKGFRNLKEQMALAEKTAEALREKIKQVQETSSQTSTGAKKLGDSVKSASKSFSGLASSSTKAIKPLNNLGNSFKSLLRTILPILGIRQLFNWGKQAIEVSSDLTEVQNVLDTTFGDMAYKVEEFAETSIEKFGMSELALKQISSRFQAMGTAMGFPIDKMSDMSVELTGLAADMASFYNVSQEDVAKSLESIFTGTTRPMRQYGIDLTQATLQEWALKQGMDANIQSMSQAEKTMLRYQYVMANTGAAQGDFARTANTWANQVRILKQNFQQLASIIGGVLVNAFKPVVKAINAAMSHIIAFAKTISNALGQIFGWKYEESGGGITQDFEDAADASDGMASGTGETLDNLKKMQKYIAPWHEVNNMTTDSGDSGAGGGAGGGGIGGGAGIGSGDGWVKGDSILKAFESEIDTLYKLGKHISDTLSDVMESIKWDKVYEKARNFGKGLAEFLNGLINPRLFGNVGKTIAGALNTVVYSALSFGLTFDFVNLGESIAEGVNQFFATFDFGSLAEAINVWVIGLKDTLITTIKKINWGSVIKGALDFAFSLDVETVTLLVGAIAWKYKGKKLTSVVLGETFKSFIGGSITAKLNSVLVNIPQIALSLSPGAIGQLGIELEQLLSGTIFDTSTWKGKAKDLHDAITRVIDSIGMTLSDGASKLGEAVRKALDSVFNWDATLSVIEDAKENFKKGGANILLGLIEGFVGAIGFIVEPIGDLFVLVWDTICNAFGIHSPAEEMKPLGENILLGLIQGMNDIRDDVRKFISGLPDDFFEWMGNLKEKFLSKGSDIMSGIRTGAENKWKEITSFFSSIPDKISKAIGSLFKTGSNAMRSFVDGFKSIKIPTPHFEVSGSLKIAGIDTGIPRFNVNWYRAGGFFPSSYSLIGAGENGVPEILGSVGGRPAIAGGDEITGISDTIRETSNQQMRLMTEEISILRTIVSAIYEKETGQSASDLFNSVRNEARSYHKRTGRNALIF